MKLFTIGYEGFEIEEFTAFLAKKRIRRLIDTRKNPVSRKKGFSKHKLAAALAEKKIDYFHLPGLGTPTEWRHQEQRGEITREKMFRDYVKKVLPKAEEDLDLARELAEERTSVLLCYEADAGDCHRFYVARAIQSQDLEVVHLSRPDRRPSDLVRRL